MDSKKLRTLGIDYGHKRLGVALSDPEGLIASPIAPILRNSATIDTIAALINEHSVGCVVLGLPLQLNGEEGSEAKNVRQFGEKLQANLNITIDYMDERMTTKEANRKLISGNVRRDKRKNIIDSIAASIILQTFLDQKRNS